jgi:hypothetical protein
MIVRTTRRLLIALLGAGIALTGTAGAAVAAPARLAPLHVTATDMTYGQPDLTGFRRASTTITIANNTRRTIAYPTLTFPRNGRDDALHTEWSGCPTAGGRPDAIYCVTEPLAAGETRDLVFPFSTYQAGPAGPARVRADVGSDPQGTPVPGTRSGATWRVTFAPLTGTFGIVTDDMHFGDRDAQGARHAVLQVTLNNLTDQTVGFPTLTFPPGSGIADTGSWSDCAATYPQPDAATACVAEPLRAGERRPMTFAFSLVDFMFSHPDTVTVAAATSADPGAPVLAGTAAGSTYDVFSPDDNA